MWFFGTGFCVCLGGLVFFFFSSLCLCVLFHLDLPGWTVKSLATYSIFFFLPFFVSCW